MDNLSIAINKYFPAISIDVIKKLDIYMDLLLEWNKKFNLVARSITKKDELIYRHIVDCLQLSAHISNKKSRILDLGSGAGLPGIILAINDYSNISLIEINQKKCMFLQKVVSHLDLKTDIMNCSYTDIKESGDFIISRAVDSLINILHKTQNMRDLNTAYIIHKSFKQKSEIDELNKKWLFKLQVEQNIINNEGMIVKISEIKSL